LTSQQEPFYWENLNYDDRSQGSFKEHKPVEEIVKEIYFKSITQQEILHDEHADKISTNTEWIEEMNCIEPRTSSSMELDNVDRINQVNFNIDSKSVSYADEEELDYLIVNEFNEDLKNPKTKNDTASYQNAIEFFDPMNTTDETTLSINSDEELGSFIEQVEKYEIISNDNILNKVDQADSPTTYNCANIIQHSVEEERTLLLFDNQTETKINSEFSVERDNLKRLVEQIETPKWEQPSKLDDDHYINENLTNTNYTTVQKKECFRPIEIKIQRNNNPDTESLSENETSTSDSSSTSGNVHLIESVEIVTHHQGDSNCQIIENLVQDVHIHKVDINRLRIKEKTCKSSEKAEENDTKYKVNFKQEELVDLRGEDESTEQMDLTTDKVFAKKFAQQISKLSSSKIIDIEQNRFIDSEDSLDNTLNDESIHKYENLNFNKISAKSTSEILESLSHLKTDIGKHLTDSVIEKVENTNQNETSFKSKNEMDFFDSNDMLLSEPPCNININYDDEGSLKEAQEEFFENFSNRLHSSSNYDNNSINDKCEEGIEPEFDPNTYKIPVSLEDLNNSSISIKELIIQTHKIEHSFEEEKRYVSYSSITPSNIIDINRPPAKVRFVPSRIRLEF
jgi:hypothetical protein